MILEAAHQTLHVILHLRRSANRSSAIRIALAMIVSEGLTALSETKQEASTTSRLSRSSALQCKSRTLLAESLPMRQVPFLRYCTNKGTQEYIAFADASAGQQATALLTDLLNQPGATLIVDQPEDDVDSKMSQEIVRKMWTAKTRRQFTFASHNANLVVNGDAELVICCDYLKAGDQTGGYIKALGSIDSPIIKVEITSVTEGGKEAFKLHKEKYGF